MEDSVSTTWEILEMAVPEMAATTAVEAAAEPMMAVTICTTNRHAKRSARDARNNRTERRDGRPSDYFMTDDDNDDKRNELNYNGYTKRQIYLLIGSLLGTARVLSHHLTLHRHMLLLTKQIGIIQEQVRAIVVFNPIDRMEWWHILLAGNKRAQICCQRLTIPLQLIVRCIPTYVVETILRDIRLGSVRQPRRMRECETGIHKSILRTLVLFHKVAEFIEILGLYIVATNLRGGGQPRAHHLGWEGLVQRVWLFVAILVPVAAALVPTDAIQVRSFNHSAVLAVIPFQQHHRMVPHAVLRGFFCNGVAMRQHVHVDALRVIHRRQHVRAVGNAILHGLVPKHKAGTFLRPASRCPSRSAQFGPIDLVRIHDLGRVALLAVLVEVPMILPGQSGRTQVVRRRQRSDRSLLVNADHLKHFQ
mmetsp:Transcript_27675/g.77549  ORF Transcript_27675/g.77549 Transcript_27675/m.77549 type:complete len:420 (+) Transcript_27675:1513-2772(+)